MKCKIAVDDARIRNPKWDRLKAHKLGRIYRVPPYIPCEKGTVIDCPKAWRLVLLGMAVPADDECQQATGYTPEFWQKWNKEYRRINSGRATGDERYDAPAPEDSADDAVDPPAEDIEMVED